MEPVSANNAGQGDSSATAPKPSLGRMLREARERLGLSVADVADQIKFAPRQIEALEADDFRRLPEMPFVRGFVRSYARILHLDAQTLVAALPQAETVSTRLEPASVEVPFPVAHSVQRQNMILLGAALLLAVLVVAFAVWHFTTPQAPAAKTRVEMPLSLPEETMSIPAQAVPEVAEAAPAASAVMPALEAAPPPVFPAVAQAKPKKLPGAPSQTAALRLAFDGESWVEIRDKDDNILSSQINLQGSELRLDGDAPFSLVIGQGASVRLYYKGKQVDLTPHISSLSGVARLTLE
ncbi:MAG: DUF4115 domain-containing protein [Nitrosomonadales bacterium]|nr:DUF4115 domain-containing protein [Nitrosomonadales bacterium]